MRLLLTALLAGLLTLLLDHLCKIRGLLPPGFRDLSRRVLGWTPVALIFWISAYSSVAGAGEGVEPDLSQLTTPELFFLHFLLILTIGVWFLLGFAGVLEEAPPPAAPPPPSLLRQFLAQFGFLAPSVPKEVGIGLAVGVGSWGVVLAVALVAAGIVMALGGEDSLPKQPPALIPWLAALPVGVRLLISLSAGVVEETFFRGFLQPRIGIFLSTLLFVFAHFSYGQPFMLVGIATLSVIYAFLVQWRQNLWPAIAAHTLFDAVQLLVIIPIALRYMEKGGN